MYYLMQSIVVKIIMIFKSIVKQKILRHYSEFKKLLRICKFLNGRYFVHTVRNFGD